MIKKQIRIKLTSVREAWNESFFGNPFDMDENMDDEAAENEDESPIELFSEGELYITDERVIIAYDESELTGMEGSHTQVRFERNHPGMITMLRSGSTNTILVFEKNKRHICTYQTQYMPFEVCIFTKEVKNTLLENGRIELEYIVEIRGAQAERTEFTVEIFEDSDEPD